MNKIILQLTEDHHRMDELLNLLAKKLTVLASDDDFDCQFFLGILEYFEHQPNVFHHPLEELIFDRLWHHRDLRSVIEKLQDEHSKLSIQTKECRTIFIRWRQEGELWDRTRASELIEDYIDVHRQHMALEERELFPFAVDTLTDANWKNINEYAIAAAPSADPVFGPTVIERYRNIQSNIQEKLG